jgi:DNA-binding NtrC family response regulator
MSQEMTHIWFCSPDPGFSQIVAQALGPEYEVLRTGKLELAGSEETQSWCDVILLDLRQASEQKECEEGLRFLHEVQQSDSPRPAIVILCEDGRSLTCQVMEHGAYDTIASPPNMAELRSVLARAYKSRRAEQELHRLRLKEDRSGPLFDLVGASECLREVLGIARKLAACDVSVLITGETGTGKELMARAIHRLSARVTNPFVAFSCANLPETLVEDELFGHEKGAFTGAVVQRRGRVEAAEGGTLFLDEIGDLSLSLQPKLLRVLQERTFERLGTNTPRSVNLRLICATHRNLAEMVQQGKFREDLYYRLNVMQLHLPPLRERRDDIPLLANHFLARFAEQFNRGPRRFSRVALQALEEYKWPGNVRELENVIQRALVLAEGRTIESWHLPIGMRGPGEQPRRFVSYAEEVREFKRRLLVRTLRESGWSKAEAARTLGLARNYLHRLINQLEIQPEEENPALQMFDSQPPTGQVM